MMEDLKNDFGKRFLQARHHLLLLQSDISKETGLTAVKIGKVERSDKKTPYPEHTDFLISKGISRDWLLYGTGEMLKKEEKAEEENNSLDLQRINEEQEKIIEQQAKMIQSQSNIIQKMESRLSKVQDQMDNLTTTFNNFMTMVMANGMQLLPKQQVVGQQQDFSIAGVSQVLVAMDYSNVLYIRKFNVKNTKNRFLSGKKVYC